MNLNPNRVRSNGLRGRLASVHGHGRIWRVVVAEASPAVQVLATRTLERGDQNALNQLLEEFEVRRLVVVAPASKTIAKLTALPAGAAQEVAGALRLLGEAQLPSQIPGYRRGYGALNGTTQQAELHGLITALVGEAEFVDADAIEEVSYTSEAAAWLTLLERSAPGTVVSADRGEGSICVTSTETDAPLVRTIREHAEDEESWRELVDRAVTESVEAGVESLADQSAVTVESDWLIRVPPEVERELAASIDTTGSSGSALAFGPAFGAAMGALKRGTEAGTLFGLRAAAVHDRRNVLQRCAALLGGRGWAAVIVVSLLIALLAPLGAAAGRYAILNVKSGGLEEQEARKSLMASRLALYKELEQRRWPMTKLLSHVAAALPLGDSAGRVTAGVTIESVRLDAGRGERVLLSGRAESFELLNKLLRNLSECGVFGDVKADRSQIEEGEGAQRLAFDISMLVVRPFAEARGLEDFSDLTLAVRLYGEEGAARLRASGGRGASQSEDRASTGRRNGARNGQSDETQAQAPRERPRRDGGEGADEPIPPALTENEIASLDRQATMKEFGNRRRAASRGDIDAAVRQRLNDEVEMLRNRLRSLSGGGS